jgi:nucleotide sugar dehydrogenase
MRSNSKSKDLLSISPITNKSYKIPKKIDDKDNIDQFLSKNKDKKIVVVQGLGYVGSVMAVVCANAIDGEYAVLGIDLPNENSFWKTQSLNDGEFPLKAEDPKIEQFYRNALHKGNFYATCDDYVYSLADIVIVDIGLDVQIKKATNNDILEYDVSLSNFKNAIKSIASKCKEDLLILVETTVPPGTTEKIVKRIIKSGLKKRGLSNHSFKLGHSSERVMPGENYIDSIQNFYRVYSGIDKKSADATESFLKTIISTENYPLTRLSSTNATEISKVLENSYRAVNIAFIEEWSRFAEESGVNLFEIIDAIKLRPTHSNMMFPGIGVGGYCLTKDPLLANWSLKEHFESSKNLDFSERSVFINNMMPKSAFKFLVSKYQIDVANKDVLLLGVTYRGDVSDTRSSPVNLFYDECIQIGCNVYAHDPYVNYWEEKQLQVHGHLGEVLTQNFDVVVISAGHSKFKSRKFIDNLILARPKLIYDSIGLLKEQDIKRLKKCSKVCVIGRGDI